MFDWEKNLVVFNFVLLNLMVSNFTHKFLKIISLTKDKLLCISVCFVVGGLHST